MPDLLSQLIAELAAGRLRVVDLTLPLCAETPLLPLPPQWNNTPPFSTRELSRYDDRGPAWYWNSFETGEHTGTHFDAPVHWISGKDCRTIQWIAFHPRNSWARHAWWM